MIVLGIDPGFVKFGWCVLKKGERDICLVDCGCIENKKGKDVGLLKIYNEVEKIIKKYKPDTLAIEEIFFSKNIKTALSIAEVRGIVILCGIKNKIKVVEFTPLQVKQSVVGYGRATKKQVKYMVNSILKLKNNLSYDTYDAISVALCYINSYKIREL